MTVLTEVEKQEIIEAAKSWAAGHYSNHSDPVDWQEECYIAGATAMAEKKKVQRPPYCIKEEKGQLVCPTQCLDCSMKCYNYDNNMSEHKDYWTDEYVADLEAQLESTQEELRAEQFRVKRLE